MLDLLKSELYKKENLYTIVLDYKMATYVYQVTAENSLDANVKWVKQINLEQIGIVENQDGIKKELISDAMNKDFVPVLINDLQSVWDSSVHSFFNKTDDLNKEYPAAYIIATDIIKKHKLTTCKQDKQNLFMFSKNESKLYTIQLDCAEGTDIMQVFAGDPLDAKIKFIKQLEFKKIYIILKHKYIPKNISEIKASLLVNSNEQEFIPKPIDNMDSVWSTFIQLGDEIGRVTIVATQANVYNFPQS